MHQSFYFSNQNKLTVCPSPSCSSVHGVSNEDYDFNLGLANYDVWPIDISLVKDSNVEAECPYAVCSDCIDNYHFLPKQRCSICLVSIPANTDPKFSFSNLASHTDTNYHTWYLCNSCANGNWKTSVKCVCGRIVRESELIRTVESEFILHFNHDHHKVAWNALALEADAADNHSFKVNIQKACVHCAGPMGAITEYGRNALKDLFDDDRWINHHHFPLSNQNIIDYKYVFSKDIKVYEQPTVISYVKNQNVGKIGYVTPYNELF
jgi:hypothetical protein